MVVEPAINSKQPSYHTQRFKPFIGKGIASLDDFTEIKDKVIIPEMYCFYLDIQFFIN